MRNKTKVIERREGESMPGLISSFAILKSSPSVTAKSNPSILVMHETNFVVLVRSGLMPVPICIVEIFPPPHNM